MSQTSEQVPEGILDRSIALVGIMGAGKTAVGRALGRLTKTPFLDSDHEIEESAGMSVPDIFDLYGEDEFRTLERRVIARLLGNGTIVLGTGGGAFIQDETRSIIQRHATVVWLKADLETVFERVRYRSGRPLLATADPRATLLELMEKRSPIYARADIVVQSHADGTPVGVARAILDAVQESHLAQDRREGGVA